MRVSSAFGIPYAVVRNYGPALLALFAAPAIAIVALHPDPPPLPVIVPVFITVPVRVAVAVPMPMLIAFTAAKSPDGCDDPLTGTWVARTYRTEHADWHDYTLTLARRGQALVASLSLKAWVAGPHDATIPQCPLGGPAVEGHQIGATAAVTPTGLRIDAHSSAVSALGSCMEDQGYSNDHFTGALDSTTHVLEMRNTDDGHYANDRPYHFKRVSCH